MALPWADWTCSGCGTTNEQTSNVEEQYSLGVYAGRYCPACWEKSGYRKAGAEGFSPDDAGESYDGEDY